MYDVRVYLHTERESEICEITSSYSRRMLMPGLNRARERGEETRAQTQGEERE